MHWIIQVELSKGISSNTICINDCKFANNKNELIIIYSDLQHVNGTPVVILAGPIILIKTYYIGNEEKTDDLVYFHCVNVQIDGALHITDNYISNIFTFEACQVEFAKTVVITSNICINVINLGLGTTYLKIIEQTTFVWERDAPDHY